MKRVVLLAALGGCYVEATAGIGKWQSHTYGGYCPGGCGEEWIWNDASVDVGVSIGATIDNGVAGARVGARLSADRARPLLAVASGFDLHATDRVYLTIGYDRLVAPRGHDLFVGLSYAHLEQGATYGLGVRTSHRWIPHEIADARYHEMDRDGLQVRARWNVRRP